MKVYIAGPMTGLPDFNFPAFNAAAAAWRAKGWEVINPAELDQGVDVSGWTREDFLARDIPYVIHADALATLSGWSASFGANYERMTASYFGKRIFNADHPAPVPVTDHTFSDTAIQCCERPDYMHLPLWRTEF